MRTVRVFAMLMASLLILLIINFVSMTSYSFHPQYSNDFSPPGVTETYGCTSSQWSLQYNAPETEFDMVSQPLHAETTTAAVPNESGKIIIVMFHKFAEHFYVNPRIPQPYTITFRRFKKLLQTLYDQNYRLISLNDFLDNRIDTPAGTTPIVFTFDDATAGQFHLEERDGTFSAAPDSAVGIMEGFSRAHPDFGLEGTFFINLGNAMPVFEGAGTLSDRLQYLVDNGFEIGNHTYSHVDLSKALNARAVVREVGKNQQALHQYLPGYQMRSMALPYGRVPVWKRYALKGEFEGVPYENRVLLSVGSKPTYPLSSISFVPPLASRVRAPGRFPEVTDLDYWLKNMAPESRFISDGNPHVVTVPKSQSTRLALDFIADESQQVVVY